MIIFSTADSFFSLISLHNKDVQKRRISREVLYISCIAWEVFNG